MNKPQNYMFYLVVIENGSSDNAFSILSLIGFLYRMTDKYGTFVKCSLSRKTKYLEKYLPRRQFVHHKFSAI